MNNIVLLQQLRKSIAFQIAQSPSMITVKRIVDQVPDGAGGMMPDPNGTPTDVQYVVRLSHERGGVQQTAEMAQGFDTSLSRWVLGNHLLVLKENEVFTIGGETFKVGRVDALRKFGGVIAYQAALYPAGSVPLGEVTGVTITDVGPIDLTVDETFQVTASVQPLGAVNQNVTWRSSDEDVATVSDSGLVTAIGPGSAIITVTTDEGPFSDTLAVEVGT